ncbi:hypothetical protein TanjilG_01872 [Lupinus angustifolius]|uniref:C3H1-type domain-containing protein n=1 Tax=Lupinus angustifolius TaxID=3871 RepID=A0A1J7IQN8_LUPAN|nr:PREDICTED: uncharacterized protein At1g21580-like isoform X2 [Lupinus angustifolius]OIW16633.1 hypothetical protein TanjilG_01872 [Lupinus angustifolius]
MDQHHSHHFHRTRYAPLSSQHHHHHHHNPNHLPPPPSLPPPPPPQPPHAHPSSYPPQFHPNHPVHISNSHNHHNHVPRRSFSDFDQSSWNPNPRDVPENRPPRNYSPVDFDRQLHHRPVERVLPPPPPLPQYQPIDNRRYDRDDGSSRLRMERMDVYESKPREREREEFVWSRGGEENYHHRDFGLKYDSPSQSVRDIDVDLKPEGYVRVYDVGEVEVTRGDRRNVIGESKKWINDRQGPRELRDSSKNEIGAAGNKNGFQIVSGKRDYYGNELGRYNSRGNIREGAHEFTHTSPHKQIQKKSALLRLQTLKPNHRNRENEQLRYTGYAAENNSSFVRGKEQHQAENNSNYFRGKEQHGYGHGVKAEERKRSPVELDISFESNSLVAKAIVAPSSSAVVCDTNKTPVSDTDMCSAEKRRKVLVSDSDRSGLPTAKLSAGSVRLGSSPSKANDTSSSAKDLSSQKNVSDTCSPPCAIVADNSHGKNEATLSNVTTNVCAEKSSTMVVKKKKIVRRVVKKVIKNPNSTVSPSPSADTHHGAVQRDSLTFKLPNSSAPDKIETSLKEKSTTVDKVSIADCLHSLPNEGNVLPEDMKEGLSPLSLGPHSRSQECKTNEDSDSGKSARFEGDGNISNSPSHVSSSIDDKQSDFDCLVANNSARDLLSIPNIDEVTKSLNGITSEINDMVYDNKQLCQNEVSLSLVNYPNIGFPQNSYLVDVGDEMNCRLVCSSDNIVNTDLINTCDSANDRVYCLNSNYLTGSEKTHTGSVENFTVSESGNDGIVGKAYCENKAPTITQNVNSEENPDTAVPSSGMIAILSSGNTGIEEGPNCIQHSSLLKQGSDNESANSEDSITVHCFNTGKLVPPSDATISPENCDTEETLSNLKFSVGFDEGKTNKINEREVKTHLNILCSKMEGVSTDPVNPDSYATDVDRASNFLKNPSPSQDLDKSVQSLDFNSKPSADEVTTLHGKLEVSEAECYIENNVNDDANKVSRVSKRKKLKKVTAGHPRFTDAIVVTTSCADVPTSFSNNQPHEKESALSSMGTLSIAQSIPSSEDISKLPNNILVGGSFDSIDADRGIVSSEHLELQHSDIASYSLCENVAILNVQFSMLQGRPKENSIPILPISSTQTDTLIIGHIKGEKTDLQAVEENYQYRGLVQISPSALMESNDLNMESNDLNTKDDLLPQQNLMSCPTNGDGVNTINSDELIEDVPDALSNMCSKGMASEDYSKVQSQGLNSYDSELNGCKNQAGGIIPKTSQGLSFTLSKTKSKAKTSASSTHISKPRTWHRALNTSASLPGIKPLVATVPPKGPILVRKGNFQKTSYIRKGNSLVRKPSPVSASPQISSAKQSTSFDLDELPKSTRSERQVDVIGPILKAGVTSAPQQRQRTPPAPINTMSEENMSPPLVGPPSSVCYDAPNSCENATKHYETPNNQTGPSNNEESQVEANDENVSSLNAKRVVYIKPKTNKLVATSTPQDVSVSTDDKAQTTFSDGYYKRSKNQLVRTTFESRINQTVAMPNSTVNSDRQVAHKVLCNRRFSKRRSNKVAGSSCKPLRASLVWTLRGGNSSKNDSDSRYYQKVLPHLFPWKRATYLRGFVNNYSSSSNRSSLSAISKKLLLLRKRDTVYTRSTHGFSLWKSKVLGVGGSSLKWSKSLEKHSKQANEEATLAVAAVERKKREQEDATFIGSQAKRERIFRIGSVRYRMDPSRRTLQRISDGEPLSSASVPSGLTAKRAYIPKRLVIGNDEYVRIGNGNQLIRDPKKRTRKLANEKVRWSLHTARQRLARKQKYCQFFTRFGKCNKDGGKCPYIHDPLKIAVCTKFLKGLCSTPNCKLTHKVIPDRMPDCSYFLQGLCTNRDCPYRHVNVNPKASICEGFLKGYCANGNECRKKHSYVCPTFETTGTCSDGTKCKLHHPLRQSKGKKRKRSEDQNSRGRYFGSSPIHVYEPGMVVAPKQHQQNDDDLEELPDYIGLDGYFDVDEEVTENIDQSFEQAACDSDSLDLQLDNLDDLIKPVLIMKSSQS